MSGTQPPGKTKFRKFVISVKQSAFEQWPGISPIYKWLCDEGASVKRGWVLFGVIFIAGVSLTGWGTYKYMDHKIESSHESKKVVKSGYEEIYKKSYLDLDVMHSSVEKAYDAGDYAYTVKFFQQAVSLDTSRNHVPLLPLAAAARYSQDPTEEGKRKFEKELTDFVGDLKQHASGPNHSDNKELLGFVLKYLNKIEEVVPTEKPFIDHIGTEVIEIKKTLPD
jgi:hypothetical protein